MSHTPPTGHCRAQRHALEYYSTGASPMVIPSTMLSEAQEYDWAACYDEMERWHTPKPESVHEQGTSCSVEAHELSADDVQRRGRRGWLECTRGVVRWKVRSCGC
jgi:GH24 family phage-related lysozyme (muramidase)